MCNLCNTIDIVSELSTDYITQANNLFEGIASKIWKGQFSGAIDDKLTKLMAANFHAAIEGVYGHSLEGMSVTSEHFTFLSKAERSAYEFATAKCRHLISDLKTYKDAALNEKDYKKAALGHYTNMTKNHQETELIFAEGEVNKALRWREIKSQMKEFPIGEYVAVHDERVRASHFEIDGTRLPWNHPWWKSHRPPIDYRCRCKAIQDSNISNITPPDKINNYNVKKPFINEHLDKGMIFSHKHSYFPKNQNRLIEISKLATSVAPWRTIAKNVVLNSFHQTDKLLAELPYAKILAKRLNTEITINPYYQSGKHADFLIGSRELTHPDVLTNKIDLKNVSTGRTETIAEALKRGKDQGESIIVSLDADSYTSGAIIHAANNHKSYKFMLFTFKGRVAFTEGINAGSVVFKAEVEAMLK